MCNYKILKKKMKNDTNLYIQLCRKEYIGYT